jgi:hypothetical protein
LFIVVTNVPFAKLVEPSGSVIVPATKSRKTAPDAMPVISSPLTVVRRDPKLIAHS